MSLKPEAWEEPYITNAAKELHRRVDEGGDTLLLTRRREDTDDSASDDAWSDDIDEHNNETSLQTREPELAPRASLSIQDMLMRKVQSTV